MSDQRPSYALIDLLAVAISPVLVMMMVGSLVFFLIEVLYAGKYSDRLLYTFFFFVIGAVLIARISIELGASRAGIYAACLGGACFLAMLKFVEYPNATLQVIGPILNLFLMGLVWWSAHRLTWDCTHLDEDRKASGRGVLAAAGLEESKEAIEEDEAEPVPVKGKKRQELSWWERWQKYRQAQKKKPHTPGTWILYFGLAALPLFALGQSLIPSTDGGRRRATFLQMAVYVGSALALLVTTTLFGLRKYLDERNARIPATMTLGWLGLGGGLIVTFIVLASVLPRPHSETPLITIQKGGKQNRKASNYAQVKDNAAGEGKGTQGKKTEAGDGKSNAKGGKQGGSKGDKQSGGGKGDQQGGNQSGGDKQGQKQSDQEKNQKSQNGPNKADSSKDKEGSKSNEQQDSKEKTDGGDDQDSEEQDSQNDGNDSSSSSTTQLSQALEKISEFVKWIVWIIVAIAVIIGVIWFLLRGLAPFTKWAQDLLNWLKSLFGVRDQQELAAEERKAEQALQRPPPFGVFSNPFTDGSANQREPNELVEYSFSALDSWAWEQGEGREPEETPMEFAVRLGHTFDPLDEPAFNLAELYVRAVYSAVELKRSSLKPLEEFWDVLEELPTKPKTRQPTS
jgi:hypothetical protein